jgi:hypothetical protein
MEIVVGAIVLGLLPAFVAMVKGRSFFLWWIYGAGLLIIALPHSLIMKATDKTIEEEALADGSGKKCPYCAEVVKSEAKVCRFCQHKLSVVNESIEEAKVSSGNWKDRALSNANHCESCDSEIPRNTRQCKKCEKQYGALVD